jgi:hypothetical protein
MRGEESAYRVLVVKPEIKGPLEITAHIWEDNIEMNLR